MIELVMVVVVVAIITSWVLPDSNTESKQQSESAGRRLESDIAYARSLSVARPDDPVVLKMDPDTNSYWLARSSNESTPIKHPQTGKDYVVKYGTLTNCGLNQVSLTGTDLGGDNVLKFDGMGNLDQSTEAVVQLQAGGAACEIMVSPSGGDCGVSSILTKTLTDVSQGAKGAQNLPAL
jgi:Tfp pilus assembly protein FimT